MAKDAKTSAAGQPPTGGTQQEAGPPGNAGPDRFAPERGGGSQTKTGARRTGKRPPKESLQLGLDTEDIRLAKSRAAADAASARRFRFWRGLCIVVLALVALIVWAYVNAHHLGLPVERWQRAIEADIERIVTGDGEMASDHAAGADAPIVESSAEPAASPPNAGGLSAAETHELERLLAELDFETGPVDGVIDTATQRAIRNYQAIAGLAETGEPSKALLADLREVRSLMDTGGKAAD